MASHLGCPIKDEKLQKSDKNVMKVTDLESLAVQKVLISLVSRSSPCEGGKIDLVVTLCSQKKSKKSPNSQEFMSQFYVTVKKYRKGQAVKEVQ